MTPLEGNIAMKVRSKSVAFIAVLMLLSKSTSAVEQPTNGPEKADGSASVTKDDSWELRGQVVDQEGRPVADVDISAYWTANGITLEELRMLRKEEADDAKFAVNEGQMEPWGRPVKTDAHGRFSTTMSYRDYKLLAIDKQRKRGAMIVLTGPRTPSSVKVKLVPLVRLHGRVRIASTGQAVKDVTVGVRMPHNEQFPLGADRFAMCSSLKSRFEFWLPPGDYQLEAFGHITPPHELSRFQSITLRLGQREAESEVLELTPEPSREDWIKEAKATGQWTDIRNRYGKPAPAWHFADARGIAKNVTVSDFEGKWVLLYFWGPWCSPCLGRQLPQLVKFYDEHAADRDRFEIVAICVDHTGELKSLKDLDRRLEPIVKHVWNGRQLPFPFVLDASFRTCQSFGFDGFGKVLIDPQGRLVEGDEKTLAEKLKESPQTNLKQ